MKKILMFLFFIVLSFNGLVYAQEDTAGRTLDAGYFDKEEISESLKNISEFSDDSITSMFITEKELRTGFSLLPAQRIDDILKTMTDVVVIIATDNADTQAQALVIFMRLADKKNAMDFVEAEKEVMALKDVEYKDYILSFDYKTLPLLAGGNAFISRKEVKTGEQETQSVTVLVTAKDNLVLELNLLKKQFANEELVKLNDAIWNALGK